MEKAFKSSFRISLDVNASILSKEITLDECARNFNGRYADEILLGSLRPINKDFIQRVRTGAFKVINKRIVKLCEYLGVDPYDDNNAYNYFDTEFTKVQELALRKPELASQIRSLLKNIINITSI